MRITRAYGEEELFNEEKIVSSLIRAGASRGLADETVRRVKKKARAGVSSNEIYKHVLRNLWDEEPVAAMKYSLKRALMKLGPAGFIFEKYVAAILREYGYSVEAGKIVEGYCVSHEVDVIAQKGNKHFMVECKYHNRLGVKSDVKAALYVHARFLDVAKSWREQSGHGQKFHQAWLVTNTKVTSEAIKFGCCVGLNVVAWRYPRERGLESMIEEKKLYPAAILPSLTRQARERLAVEGIVLARDLLPYRVRDLARLTKIQPRFARKLQEEARQLSVQ